jgi:oligopeptide/dipeptide ABC transporter ATP-binding protein
MDLAPGETVGVVGESGCGKSTLARCAVGLAVPTAGEVFWQGVELKSMRPEELRRARKNFQMVFQNPFSSLNPRRKVREILLEPLEAHGLSRGSERESLAVDLLRQVGLLPEDMEKFPHEFSGGQRQRIGLARAFISRPGVVILDEPVSSLDVSVQASILNLLVSFNKERGVSYLFISHDLQVVGYLSDRLLVMYLGRVVEEGKSSDILANPAHPYTRILLEASEAKKVEITGEPPSPVHLPSGCPFHPRCPHAENRCREEAQELLEGPARDRKVACWKWDKL